MLRIIVKGDELFNESDDTFEYGEDTIIDLEHSLLSLSKWESKYQRPFLSESDKKTPSEIVDYIRFMVVSPMVDPDVLDKCSRQNWEEIQEYINSDQSATTFGIMPEHQGPGETITSELIYYWMVTFRIPFDVETWHLNRLFALVRICNIKQSKPKKLTSGAAARQRAELNAKRRAELGTSG